MNLLKIAALSGFLLVTGAAAACDHCACGATNYYLGVMPQFNRHLVGLRYRISDFSTTGHHEATRETYQVADLWARFYPHRNVQVLAFLPYQFGRQRDANQARSRQGAGDAVVMANYNVLNRLNVNAGHTLRHSAWLGGGLKLPTGRYRFDASDANTVANVNFQPGTGSWDFLLQAIYTLRVDRLGLSADCTYRINTANRENYRFGNRVSGTLAAFYVQKLGGGCAIMPSLGVYAEQIATDQESLDPVPDTGGYMLCGQAGAELYFLKNFALSAGWQMPVAQSLNRGYSTAKGQFMAGFTVLF